MQPGGCGLDVVVEHAIQLPEVELFGKLGGTSYTPLHAEMKVAVGPVDETISRWGQIGVQS